MRILAANPDGLGDLILRQPLYAALAAAGHELMLTVRTEWAEFTPRVAAGAAAIPIPIDPYTLALSPQYDALQPLLNAALTFAPDLFLVSPFQWTPLEEWLGRHLTTARVVGMKGRQYEGDPRWGIKLESTLRFDAQVDVAEDLREVTKNEKLASLLLGRHVTLPDPRVTVTKDAIAAAKTELARLGLTPYKYWIASVGHGPYKQVRNWKLKNWAETLDYWANKYGRRFLLLGDEQEYETTEAVRFAVTGRAAAAMRSLCRKLPLPTLAALSHLSRGYIGKDTGPMHLAAALGKPVIAVFGGGTWPRFQPCATPSWIGMINVPCTGCHWRCPFDESYCVKHVPLGEVIKAIDLMESGELTGRIVRAFRPRIDDYRAMAFQASRRLNVEMFDVAKSKRLEMDGRQLDWTARSTAQQAALDAERARANQTVEQLMAAQQRLGGMDAELQKARQDMQRMEGDLSAMRSGVADLGAQLEATRDQLEQEQTKAHRQAGELAAEKAQAAALAVQIQASTDDLLNIQARLRQAESELRSERADAAEHDVRIQETQAELMSARGELSAARQRIAPRRNRAPWPYGEPDPRALPATLPGDVPWPRISIITPSFNQGKYIEQTILSVLNQGYPNLEYIIIDGGSTDDTMAVVERYRDRITYLESEKDRGQSHAINKGFARATGDICSWLNSDDMYEPDALAAMALAFHTSGADIVAGICTLHSDAKIVGRHLTTCADGPLPLEDLLDLDDCWMKGQFFYQPEVMFKRSLWEQAGGRVDESLFYSMDYELWLRFAAAGARLHAIGRSICLFRVHEEQKTFDPAGFQPELLKVRDQFLERTGRTLRREPARGIKTYLRVLFFNDVGDFHGAGIAHQRLATAFALAGHEIIPLAIHRNLIKCSLSNDQIMAEIAIRQPELVVIGNLHAARLDPALAGLIANRWPTIQVLHDLHSITGRCAYPGDCDKFVGGCDENCPTAHEYPTMEPALIQIAWQKKHAALTSDRAPVLAANSRWTADIARRRFAEDDGSNGSVTRVPPIIEMRLAFPVDVLKPRDKSLCREMLGLPQDRFIILFSSAQLSDERKGLSHMIEALRSLKLPNLLAVCVGHFAGGAVLEGIEVRAMGYIEDLPTLASVYSAVDLYVGPSLIETFGQVFVEAAACGTPSIGYATAGGVADAVADGVSGFLARRPEATELAACIARAHDDPELRHNLGIWGRLWVENEYSLFAAYQRLFSQLNQLGVIRQLGLPPKVSFFHTSVALPAFTYLESPPPVPDSLPIASPNGTYSQLQKRMNSLEAERDSLRVEMHNITHTRLWRMVGTVYPMYMRFLGNASIPRFVRRRIEAVGRWLAARPEAPSSSGTS